MKINSDFKKRVHKYIDENLDSGYSYDSIKKAFIFHGYNPEIAESLIKSHRTKNIIANTAPLFLLLILVFIAVFYRPNVTTFAFKEKDYNYTDNVALTLNQSADYIWDLQNKGLLKSVKLNGEVKTNGSVKIYLRHGNEAFLVFDSQKLSNNAENMITGFAVKNYIDVKVTGELSSEGQTVLDSLVADINQTKNNVDIQIKNKGNSKKAINGNVTASQTLLIDSLLNISQGINNNINIKITSDFTGAQESNNNQSINETLNLTLDITLNINETNINSSNEANESLNQTSNLTENATLENISLNRINIALKYQNNIRYDENNDGIENVKSIIDITVEQTSFSWEVNHENLCTRWNVYSVDNNQSTEVCYGSDRCCNFIGLSAKRVNWNDTYYAAYGQDGATLKNIISAQVLYVDYNLSLSNPYSSIYYSDWKNLTAEFYEGYAIFENECIETCTLPYFNDTNYQLSIEVENSSLILSGISYEIANYEKANNPPVLLKNFSDISINKRQSHTINLSDYFYDEDNDTLSFTYYNTSGLNETIVDVSIVNDTVILQANDLSGTTFIYFIANDSKDLAVSNVFGAEVKERKIGPLKSLKKLIGLA